MARFLLGKGVSIKKLGHAIIEAAAKFSETGTRSREAEAKIEQMFDMSGSSKKIIYHYDTADTLNIVLPDLSGKARAKDLSEKDFDLSDIAAEAIGFIVIMGCAE